MLLLENIKLALASIGSNKMRTFLTMLGIIIGISSVITIVSLGDISKAVIAKELESIGKNRVVIYPVGEEISAKSVFNKEDIRVLQEHFPDTISYLTPLTSDQGKVFYHNKQTDLYMSGVGPGYDNLNNLEMVKGRFMLDKDVLARAHTIVIDEKMAQQFFQKEEVLGQEINIHSYQGNQLYTVVGVFREPPSIFSGFATSDSYNAFVPYSVFGDQTESIFFLDMYLSEASDPEQNVVEIKDFIARSKGVDPESYVTDTVAESQAVFDSILGTISVVLGAIAAISLLVGGIGIMNIMLVSVTERTKEIGIRKSLGAKRKDILSQFLIESMLVSAVGGLIGTIFGSALGVIASMIMHVPIQISLEVILITVGFSALVGMFFGIYPANRAAKLNPIDALRYE